MEPLAIIIVVCTVLCLIGTLFTSHYFREIVKAVKEHEKALEEIYQKYEDAITTATPPIEEIMRAREELDQLKAHNYHMPTPEEIDECIEDMDKED